MRRDVVYKFITDIVSDFGNMLTEGVLESNDLFPYTSACIEFISNLDAKGITISFHSFDQDIIDKVYRELCEYLVH